jgi:outer membrane lipoprotein-sorting protein
MLQSSAVRKMMRECPMQRFILFSLVLLLGQSLLSQVTQQKATAQPSRPEEKALNAKTPASNKAPLKSASLAKTTNANPKINVMKLADSIQRQYNNTRSASFDFQQTYKHTLRSEVETFKGHVSYDKATGNMVWNYVEPHDRQKMLFINGKKFTYFSKKDNVAYTHNCYDKDTLSAAITFLFGTGNIKASFAIANIVGESPNPALLWVSLVPKEKDSPVTKILLGVDKDGKVMESIVGDPSGGENHFIFSNFITDKKISPTVFVFTAPEGVTVQPMPNVTCPNTEPAPKKPTPQKAAPKTKVQRRPSKL